MTPGLRVRPSDPCSDTGAPSALSRSAPQERNMSSPTPSPQNAEFLSSSPTPSGTCHNFTTFHRARAAQRNTLGKNVCTVGWAQRGSFQILFLCAVSRNMQPARQQHTAHFTNHPDFPAPANLAPACSTLGSVIMEQL